MSKIDDGGRAFPSPAYSDGTRVFPASPGMSLREYYAGQYLTTLRPGWKDGAAPHALKAVAYADALIAALRNPAEVQAAVARGVIAAVEDALKGTLKPSAERDVLDVSTL